MPIDTEFRNRGRTMFNHSLTAEEAASLARNPRVGVLQTSSLVAPDTWLLLNEMLFAERPDIELRIYGFYSEVCDLSFLVDMPNVRRLSADCLTKTANVETIATLRNLEELTVGSYDLKDFEFLRDLDSSKLRSLSLQSTKSKKPSLKPLERFTELRKLSLEGQQKDIEVVSGLTNIEELLLRSISTAGLDYVRPLDNLLSLSIELGGITNLAALESMGGIKHLRLMWVRGLRDISVISTMSGLQFVNLNSLRQVKRIPDMSDLRHLRRVDISTLRGLEDISALESAPALEVLCLNDVPGLEPEGFTDFLKKATLKRATIGVGSVAKNKVMEDMVARAGLTESLFAGRSYGDFIFS